jgi:putrescine transport system ATP-binding protein
VSTEHGIVSVGHGISGAAGMAVAVAVRPEKIHIARERPQVHQNLFTGKVREIAYFGSYSTFSVEMPGGRSVKITATNAMRQGSSDITWEDPVFFWWDDSAPVVLTQ